MNLRHLLRLSQWARRPRSQHQLRFVIGILVLGLLLYATEQFIGWPDWLTVNRPGAGRLPR